MKFGIFGDIHSNQEALDAVLEDMLLQGVSQMVCVGDIVGYNANPSECLQTIQSLGIPIVKGNHDDEASEERDISDFNPLAHESMYYCRKQLDEKQKVYLRQLPLQINVGGFTVVHASLNVPACWNYVFKVGDAEQSFDYQRTQLCFFGHTHVPQVFVQHEAGVHEFLYRKIELEPDKKYMVNTGSVGQPRDGDWRAAYTLFDDETGVIELRRIPYDVAKTQRKILEAGLPARLAERLANAV